MKMAFPKVEGYVVTERIGSGSYSTVYKAYNKVGGRMTVAIKCIDKARVKHSCTAVDNLISEIRLLKTLTHTHIVTMYDFTWDQKNIYIIMEYCNGGDLSKYIHRYGRVPERRVKYFLQQLVSALQFLREKGIAHMDLKPHNLLLHKDSDGVYTLKVADFGFAAPLAECGSSLRGSPLYMPPETLLGAPPTAQGDLWSVGVIMYECLFGRAPYSSATFRELMDKVQKRPPIQIPPNSSISEGCRSLLLSLLQPDPAQRITHEELCAHYYLDMEHMPTRENYHKGVSFIRQAIEYDTAGDYESALSAYGRGLRYLVPYCDSAAKNSGVVDRVTRYMERAEAIKEYLKSPSDHTTARHTELPSGPMPPNDVTAQTDTQTDMDRVNICDGETSARAATALAQPKEPQTKKNQREDNDTCRIT